MTSSFRARRLAAAPLAFSCFVSAFAFRAQAQSPAPTDEIVVTAIPRDRAADGLAQPVAVVVGDELERIRASTLGETLANQLGVSSSYFGAGASRPIIRGLAGARVRMIEDGIDSMDAATVSDDHAVTIDPLAADQIEIFRGPTALLYGSGAVGGVVNTVTTRVPSRAPDAGFEGAVEVRGDSAADNRGAALRLDGGGTKFAWHVDGGRRESDDYEIPGYAHADADPAAPDAEDVFGVVENSAAESDALALGGSWLGDGAFLGIGISAFDTLYGIPGHHHEHDEEGEEETAGHETVRIDLEQRRVNLRGGWEGLSGVIEGVNVSAGMNDYEHVELEGEAIGTRFTNDATEVRLELLHAPFGNWSGAFGIQLEDREFAAVGEEAFVPPVDSSMTGLFVVEELDVGAWNLSFGGRWESQEHAPSDDLRAYDDSAVSTSLGAVRSFGDGYSLVTTLSLTERLPVAEELYSNGPHLATGVVQIGDSGLDKETAQHLDVGLRGQTTAIDWSVTAFQTRYDDFIYLADTGSNDPVDELPVFVYSQADATFDGIEAEALLSLLEEGTNAVELRLFADYVRGELQSAESLPRMPPLRYGGRFEYRNERLLIGLEGTRYDDQDDVAPFEDETEGYTMVNADLRWRFLAGPRPELELFVNASNLGDDEARKHTSFVKDSAPLPGRNYAVGIRSRF